MVESTTDKIKQLYKTTNSNEIDKQYAISVDDIMLTNADIVSGSVQYKESLCAEDSLKFGGCISSQFKLQCAKIDKTLINMEMDVAQYINKLYNAIGTFIISECEDVENSVFKTITAYDRMIRFDINVADWYNGLTFPINLKEFRESLCRYCCVPYLGQTLPQDGLIIEKTINPTSISGKAVLQAIAELNGGFYRIDRYGLVEMIFLTPSLVVDEIDVKNYRNLKRQQFSTKAYSKIVIRTEEDDIGGSAGTGDNAYIIEDNFLVYGLTTEKLGELAAVILEQIGTITYIPYTVECCGLPYLQCGDYVKYKTKDSEFVSVILTRNLTGTQILKDSIETKGTELTEETFGIEKDLIQLKGKTNVLSRDVEETKQTIIDVEAGLTSEIKATASGLTLKIESVEKTANTAQSSADTAQKTAAGAVDVADDNSKKLDSVTGSVRTISSMVSQLNNLINVTFVDETKQNNEITDTISKYIRFVSNPDGTVSIQLSTTEHDSLTLTLVNDKIVFTNKNGTELGTFTADELDVLHINIPVGGSVKIGNFAFIPRTNGNLSFKYMK